MVQVFPFFGCFPRINRRKYQNTGDVTCTIHYRVSLISEFFIAWFPDHHTDPSHPLYVGMTKTEFLFCFYRCLANSLSFFVISITVK